MKTKSLWVEFKEYSSLLPWQPNYEMFWVGRFVYFTNNTHRGNRTLNGQLRLLPQFLSFHSTWRDPTINGVGRVEIGASSEKQACWRRTTNLICELRTGIPTWPFYATTTDRLKREPAPSRLRACLLCLLLHSFRNTLTRVPRRRVCGQCTPIPRAIRKIKDCRTCSGVSRLCFAINYKRKKSVLPTVLFVKSNLF